MGMGLGLVTLSDTHIDRVLRDPPLIWRVIAPDDPEPYEEARAAQAKPLLSGLFRSSYDVAADADLELSVGDFTDLDKAWHGIHYLLTGTATEGPPPLNLLVAGGREVGDIDCGYGPARVLTHAETCRAHEALRALSDETLRARFDPKDMLAKEIYPEIWDRPQEQDDTLGYLMEYVQVLRRCLERAAADKLGLVLFLS